MSILRKFRRFHMDMAPAMFCLALLFLFGIAVLTVLWGAAPVEESSTNAATASVASVPAGYSVLAFAVFGVLIVIWPLFLVEAATVCFFVPEARSKRVSSRLLWGLYGLCPPLRICPPHPHLGGRLWLPGLGWRRSDRRLRRRLEKRFSKPMLLIASMILPVLLIEYSMQAQVAQRPWLAVTLQCCTGVIWFSFAAEFIVMVSVAEKKLQYCKDNWVDLAIILLPLVSFLRTLRIIKASRLAHLAKAQQLAKMARVYRLRATAVKLLRALLLLELVHRIIGYTPERKLKGLRRQETELLKELAFVREQIAELETPVEVDADEKQSPPRPHLDNPARSPQSLA